MCVLHGLHGVCYVCISWWHAQCVLFVWNGMGVYSLHVMCVCVTVYVLCRGCICGMWCLSAM